MATQQDQEDTDPTPGAVPATRMRRLPSQRLPLRSRSRWSAPPLVSFMIVVGAMFATWLIWQDKAIPWQYRLGALGFIWAPLLWTVDQVAMVLDRINLPFFNRKG